MQKFIIICIKPIRATDNSRRAFSYLPNSTDTSDNRFSNKGAYAANNAFLATSDLSSERYPKNSTIVRDIFILS
jgi:hypothetical protein